MKKNLRNYEILKEFETGSREINIAKKYGLSRERVRQILNKYLNSSEIKRIHNFFAAERRDLKFKNLNISVDEYNKNRILKYLRKLRNAGLIWSTYSLSCMDCGTMEEKPRRLGLCDYCYNRKRFLENKERHHKYCHNYFVKNKEKIYKQNLKHIKKWQEKNREKINAYSNMRYKKIKKTELGRMIIRLRSRVSYYKKRNDIDNVEKYRNEIRILLPYLNRQLKTI